MKYYGICVFGVSLILTVLWKQGNALKCWQCSSDSEGGEFCNDPFSLNNLSTQEKQIAYKECQKTEAYGVRLACKKLKEKINGKIVVKRFCWEEDQNDSSFHCFNTTTEINKAKQTFGVQILFCETCLVDGCNEANEFTPVAIYPLIPVIVAKLVAW